MIHRAWEKNIIEFTGAGVHNNLYCNLGNSAAIGATLAANFSLQAGVGVTDPSVTPWLFVEMHGKQWVAFPESVTGKSAYRADCHGQCKMCVPSNKAKGQCMLGSVMDVVSLISGYLISVTCQLLCVCVCIFCHFPYNYSFLLTGLRARQVPCRRGLRLLHQPHHDAAAHRDAHEQPIWVRRGAGPRHQRSEQGRHCPVSQRRGWIYCMAYIFSYIFRSIDADDCIEQLNNV